MKEEKNFFDFPEKAKVEIFEIVNTAIAAADPCLAVKKFIQVTNSKICIGNLEFKQDDYKRVFIISFGKAAIPMAKAASEVLCDHITGGIVITKHINRFFELDNIKYKIYQGGHPVTNETSLEGTESVLNLVNDLDMNDLVICLVSGGGSALLSIPRKGIQLNDLQITIRILLECGASIDEINTIRKHLDLVKGGGLAKIIQPAKVISLILSDVVGSPLDIIASGPTAPDPSCFVDAIKVIEKYNIQKKIPITTMQFLQSGQLGLVSETVKPGNPIFLNVHNFIIGDNRRSALAGLDAARKRGFNSLLLSTNIQGEARMVGRLMGGILKEICNTGNPVPRPACIIAGGETTVTVSGNGLGGRNLETALGAVYEMAGLKDVYFLSLASDGEDGPTDAAGAIVTGETYEKSQKLGLDFDQFLTKNDSYHFFKETGGLLKSGPTGTNVNDLIFLFAF